MIQKIAVLLFSLFICTQFAYGQIIDSAVSNPKPAKDSIFSTPAKTKDSIALISNHSVDSIVATSIKTKDSTVTISVESKDSAVIIFIKTKATDISISIKTKDNNVSISKQPKEDLTSVPKPVKDSVVSIPKPIKDSLASIPKPVKDSVTSSLKPLKDSLVSVPKAMKDVEAPQRMVVTGEYMAFSLAAPAGWKTDTIAAKRFEVPVILYMSRDSVEKGAALVQITTFKKADENTIEDLEQEVEMYRQNYPDMGMENLTAVHKQYHCYGRLVCDNKDFYQYIMYVNPGPRHKIGLTVSMSISNRAASNQEMDGFLKIIASVEAMR